MRQSVHWYFMWWKACTAHLKGPDCTAGDQRWPQEGSAQKWCIMWWNWCISRQRQRQTQVSPPALKSATGCQEPARGLQGKAQQILDWSLPLSQPSLPRMMLDLYPLQHTETALPAIPGGCGNVNAIGDLRESGSQPGVTVGNSCLGKGGAEMSHWPAHC